MSTSSLASKPCPGWSCWGLRSQARWIQIKHFRVTHHGASGDLEHLVDVLEVERLVAFLPIVSNSLGQEFILFLGPPIQDEPDNASPDDCAELHGHTNRIAHDIANIVSAKWVSTLTRYSRTDRGAVKVG